MSGGRFPVVMWIVAGVLLVGVPRRAAGSGWWGRVGGVVDGDTLTILRKQRWATRVQLHGIDAPELGQPFGADAKRSLSKLAFGKQVRVEVVGKPARSKTVVAKVYLDRRSLSELMLEAGYAWHDRCYRIGRYRALEAAARRAKRGLWGGAKPVAPWDFRAHRMTGKSPPCPVLVKVADNDDLAGALKRIGGVPPRRAGGQRASTVASSAGRPKLPRSARLACRKHRDCVFAYRNPCFCRPCGETWRRVSNRTSYERERSGWARKVPVCKPCPVCTEPAKWRGSKPVCVEGQCTVR